MSTKTAREALLSSTAIVHLKLTLEAARVTQSVCCPVLPYSNNCRVAIPTKKTSTWDFLYNPFLVKLRMMDYGVYYIGASSTSSKPGVAEETSRVLPCWPPVGAWPVGVVSDQQYQRQVRT